MNLSFCHYKVTDVFRGPSHYNQLMAPLFNVEILLGLILLFVDRKYFVSTHFVYENDIIILEGVYRV